MSKLFFGAIVVGLAFVVALFVTTALTCDSSQSAMCKCSKGDKEACKVMLAH